uniref:Ig-like domain-containing protein n=1 Tax=Maylandia zebra TaxID=106582 RepID=A0A3P9BZ72_9CICH
MNKMKKLGWLVDQTPANIHTKEKEVKIHCSHSIQNYDTILWYKQSEKQLRLLGYLRYGTSTPETGVNVTIDGSAEKEENCTLTLKDLKVSSSGVYFCAASYHSAAHHCTSIQKPIKHIFGYLYSSSHLASAIITNVGLTNITYKLIFSVN